MRVPEDLHCFNRDCENPVAWVVEWRKDNYDPWLTGQQGMIHNNACQGHLHDLMAYVTKRWAGAIRLRAVDNYAYVCRFGAEVPTTYGLGLRARWPEI